MTLLQLKIASPVGDLYLVASDEGLKGILWNDPKLPAVRKSDTSSAAKFLHQAQNELREYFAGTRKNFDVALAPEGTPFQKKVWSQLQKIPYGKTISYAELAKKIKNEKAVRAVGTANGRNPLCILIPCHRVIASDGSLGGYSGGLHIKETLLKLESGEK